MEWLILIDILQIIGIIWLIYWGYTQWYEYLETQKSIANSLERICSYKLRELSKNPEAKPYSDRIDI